MGAVSSREVVEEFTWLSSGEATWASAWASSYSWEGAVRSLWELLADEQAGVEESGTRSVGKSLQTLFALDEGLSRALGKGIVDELTISETYIDNIAFMMNVMEAWTLSDSLSKASDSAYFEDIRLDDLYRYLRAIDLIENASVTDGFTRAFAAVMLLRDNLTFADALAKEIGLSKTQLVKLVDAFLRKANAVISDILLKNGSITDAEFADLLDNAAPPGFDKFKTFLAGDHRYDEALFKHVLSATTGDRPRLTELSVKVDVPDVTDRGRVDLGAEVTFVPFNRVFLDGPEVTVTLRATSVAGFVVPQVVEITTTGFWVGCLDALDAPQAATISWIAQGF